MGEGSCNLGPELWTLHPGCGVGPEWPPGVGGGADYGVRWASEPPPRSALNKGLSQGRAGGPREFVERPGPEHKGVCMQKPRAKTKVLSALLSEQGLQQWPSHAERTKNGNCSLNGRPGPCRSLKAASTSPSP